MEMLHWKIITFKYFYNNSYNNSSFEEYKLPVIELVSNSYCLFSTILEYSYYIRNSSNLNTFPKLVFL